MQNADICIGTMGLDESIGWKTAEYIAANRALVHEKFKFELPGDFEVNRNYLEFSSAQECLEKVQFLVDHLDYLYEMKRANEKYYREYLRPDKQLWNAIQIVCDE